MIISLDTECTGLDLVHGARPFLVTTCDDNGIVSFWEWDVNPLTRQPEIPDGDLGEIQELIDAAELVYMHNSKFDVRALRTIGVTVPWGKVRDTLIAGHILATNHPHDLTWMVKYYLGVDIERYEVAVKQTVKLCRAIVKKHPEFSQWKIAREGEEGMPSVTDGSKREDDKPWKNDMWLPRALLKAGCKQYMPNRDEWEVVCCNYANADSDHTLPLGLEVERQLRERGYWKYYLHRMELPRVVSEMEEYGITARGDWTEATISEYQSHVAECECVMCDIAAGYGHNLELAAGAALNDNMREFFYGSQRQFCSNRRHGRRGDERCKYVKIIKHWNGETVDMEAVCPKCAGRKRDPLRTKLNYHQQDNLNLPPIKNGKSKGASLDGSVLEHYLQTEDGDAADFIEILMDKRKHDTAITYMEQYRRYWIPVPEHPGYYRIHPSVNPCGTDHLRMSSNSPNMQNTSSKEVVTTKACFGPAPGREFWSMDYESIEARIPAYESGEPKLLDVFEKPDEPPYWGNMYYLAASVLYPDEFMPRSGEKNRFKTECPKLYKQAKFFILAKNYGAGRKKGDLLSKVHNSYDLIDADLPLLAALQQKYLDDAERTGWVETLPSRAIDPDKGYPILAAQTDDGRVLTTTPFNYHVSGTACECKNLALIRCSEQCAKWRAEGFDAHVAMEVHDEILIDMPAAPSKGNLPHIRILQALMERSGQDLIPQIRTPVAVKYHSETWAIGEIV